MLKQTVLPKWKGFNLLDMFTVRSMGEFQENDFKWIRDWGFDFVRLATCYTLWINNDDVYDINEEGLKRIDRAVELGDKYNIHVNLSFHRGPGFSVNPERKEPFNLWKDQAALDAFCFHWELMTNRYKGISSDKLSFNMINEPKTPDGDMSVEDHKRVMAECVNKIRAIDKDRLCILDGLGWGTIPCPELIELGAAQSCRAYNPSGVSHYKASWVGGENWPEPSWPDTFWGERWDKDRLYQYYKPWAELATQGIGVHCGEGGAHCHTPHHVVLAWLKDVLDILDEFNIGLALWNFRGSFGILDSGRDDVDYEDWHGHKLDRKLLELLMKY